MAEDLKWYEQRCPFCNRRNKISRTTCYNCGQVIANRVTFFVKNVKLLLIIVAIIGFAIFMQIVVSAIEGN